MSKMQLRKCLLCSQEQFYFVDAPRIVVDLEGDVGVRAPPFFAKNVTFFL